MRVIFSMRIFVILGWLIIGILCNDIKKLHAKLRNDYDDIHSPVRDLQFYDCLLVQNYSVEMTIGSLLSCRSEFKASKTPESTALTPINITIELDWIIEVDTALGSWIGIIWFGLSWYDHRLSWDKTDYNVSKITVPGSQIWIPDFRDVELAGDGDAKSDIRKEMFVVHNDGLVIGQVRRKHTNNCIIMPKYYPNETG